MKSLQIEIDQNSGVAIVTCYGALSSDDARESLEVLWQDPVWSGKAVVWDFRQAQFDLTLPETQEVARFVLENQPDPPPSRIAFVTGRDVDFGMARVFEVHRQDNRSAFQVFRDFEEAQKWAGLS